MCRLCSIPVKTTPMRFRQIATKYRPTASAVMPNQSFGKIRRCETNLWRAMIVAKSPRQLSASGSNGAKAVPDAGASKNGVRMDDEGAECSPVLMP